MVNKVIISIVVALLAAGTLSGCQGIGKGKGKGPEPAPVFKG